jgi:hypothetical protein
MRSVSGDIQAELPQPINADISARTVGGSIRSELETPLAEGGRALRARVGSGEGILRINSGRGQITLLVAASTTGVGSQPAAPVLLGR